MVIQMNRFILSIVGLIIISGCYGLVRLDEGVDFHNDIEPLNLKSPTFQWKKRTKDPIQDMIIVNDSLVLVWTHRGSVMIMNMNNGEKQGTSWTPSMGHITYLTISNDGNLFFYISMKNDLVGAYDIRSGKHLWKNRVDDLIKNKPIILSDSEVVFGTRMGLELYDAYNGELIRKKNSRFGLIKIISSTDGRILVATDDGHLNCYDHHLKKLWTQDLKLDLHLREYVEHDRIFVGPGNDTLWVLDMKTGIIIHGLEFVNGFDFRVRDNDLFLLYRDGRLTRRDINGQTSWTSDFKLGLPIESFFHANTNLFIPFAKGVAISVETEKGMEIWRSDTLRRLTGFWRSGTGFLMQDIEFQMQYYK